ncbi:hypothetical protein SPBR_06200 [Sporothrix brasiliensis 5110]|uniref:PEBP-like protein n=1 Tax=Sporothrix brasiliensis 5110 TaxID=1398154 RepID=A0A0C2F4P0_9PEZI|nr:uncharacterized protein SPBR_06200 [Sporothrix brasiliensis 5110]KIH93899.1 hypothetical protein SPBR_06200 [Sporothrix brasiliensis 5110]
MADRFSQAVKTAFAVFEKKDKDNATGSSATLRLTFGSQADGAAPVVVDATNAGTHVTPVQATPEPALALAAAAAATAAPDTKYLAISLDPDAPFPSFPFLGPILHGVQADLTIDNTTGDAAWRPLTSSTPPTLHYIKPGPPSPSAAHRYIFLLYKQPEGLDDAAIRAKMGWAAEGPAVTRLGRMRFVVGDLETKLGLGAVVGINYFESSQ